ncbi:ANKRD17, partial [Symbiodinium pilosum]
SFLPASSMESPCRVSWPTTSTCGTIIFAVHRLTYAIANLRYTAFLPMWPVARYSASFALTSATRSRMHFLANTPGQGEVGV